VRLDSESTNPGIAGERVIRYTLVEGCVPDQTAEFQPTTGDLTRVRTARSDRSPWRSERRPEELARNSPTDPVTSVFGVVNTLCLRVAAAEYCNRSRRSLPTTYRRNTLWMGRDSYL
jgi:hypothetical protein